MAEIETRRAVLRQEFGDQLARGGVEEVGGAGELAVVVVPRCSHDGGFPADRDGEAEDVIRRAVVCQDLEELVAVRVGRPGARGHESGGEK